MSRKAKVKAALKTAPAGVAFEAPAETPAAGSVNPATVQTVAKPLTMAELLAEQYPNGAPARVSGGMAWALQRELRRRNRKAEKGY